MLFIMRGTSCSGKDTFIKQHFGGECSPHVLSSDRFREILFGSIETRHNQNEAVFRTMYEILEHRISSRVQWTVLNSTNLKLSNCNKAINICKKYKTPYTIISIEPPKVDELYERSVNRSLHGGLFVPRDVLERHYETYRNNTQYFIEEAVNSKLCSFIEIDQSHEVLKHVD